MTVEAEPQGTETTSWRPDSFARPRTYPEKWDLSSFETPGLPAKYGRTPQTDMAGESGSSAADGDAAWQPEPFPEPRTYPSKWNLSELD